MKRRRILLSLAAALAAAAPGRALLAREALPKVQVFKTPTCGCCGAWVDHLRAAGFQVAVTEVDDTASARKQHGMPDSFGSCHTAVVAGYVVEGHVPAKDVKKLLAMKPVAIGLAVPGMPLGSPGMEMGPRRDAFDVLLVAANGRARIFSSYR